MLEDEQTGQEVHRITRLAKAAATAAGYGFSGITARLEYLLHPVPHWRIVSRLEDGQHVQVMLDGQGDVLSVELQAARPNLWGKVRGWFGRR